MKHLEQIHRAREAKIAELTILLHQHDRVRGMADVATNTLLDWMPRNRKAAA